MEKYVTTCQGKTLDPSNKDTHVEITRLVQACYSLSCDKIICNVATRW